jgi:hypothetical protein
MELHDENPFKVKAIQSAAYKLGKTRIDRYFLQHVKTNWNMS